MARLPDDNSNRISPQFQSRIKEIISDSGFTLKEFSVQTGVNKDVISRATVYGILPSTRTLIKLADFANVSISYLLGETDNDVFYCSSENQTFHERLTELMNEKHLKVSEISDHMPFAANSIHEWMRTKGYPSPEYLKALANYLQVSMDYLLGRSDDR